jgi:hypothetical protein
MALLQINAPRLQNSGNCISIGGASLRRRGWLTDSGRDPNCKALTVATAVGAGVTSDAATGAFSTAGAGSGVIVAGIMTLPVSA